MEGVGGRRAKRVVVGVTMACTGEREGAFFLGHLIGTAGGEIRELPDRSDVAIVRM